MKIALLGSFTSKNEVHRLQDWRAPVTLNHTTTAAPHIVLEELNHRFMNSLQIISTLAAAQAGEPGRNDELVRLKRLRSCIGALGRLHRQLALPLVMPLEDAIVEVGGALAEAFGRTVAVRVSIQEEPAEPSLSRGLLLLWAELMTNALKHSRATPLRMEVGLTRRLEGWRLRADSNTPGAPATPRVAAALAEWLGGELSVQAGEGFAVTVDVPALHVGLPKAGSSACWCADVSLGASSTGEERRL